MESKFQTSFIPKKSLVPTEKAKVSSTSVGFFSVIGITIFLLTIAASAGVYVWKLTLNQKIENNKQILVRTEKEFDPALIEDLMRLDARIESSKEIISRHVAVSSYFELLQNITLRTIRFKSFQFTSTGKDKFNVVMQGEGDSFAAIALQSDQFGATKSIKSPIVSNLNPDQNGSVSFDFTATIDPALILYKNKVGGN